jgi:hypothetical protein
MLKTLCQVARIKSEAMACGKGQLGFSISGLSNIAQLKRAFPPTLKSRANTRSPSERCPKILTGRHLWFREYEFYFTKEEKTEPHCCDARLKLKTGQDSKGRAR